MNSVIAALSFLLIISTNSENCTTFSESIKHEIKDGNYITFKSSDKTYEIVHTPSNTSMGLVSPDNDLTLNKNISSNTTYTFQVYLVKSSGKKKLMMPLPVPVHFKGTVVTLKGKKVEYAHFK